MKKKILTIFCCLFFVGASVAAAEEGMYAGVMLGVNLLTDSDWSAPGLGTAEAEYEAGFTVAGLLGNDFGVFRVEGEFRYEGSNIDQINAFGVPFSADGDISTWSFMVNGYYDFENPSPWTPHFGAGIGVANVEIEDISIVGFPAPGSEDDTQFAYQFIIGVCYAFPERWMFNVDYRYFATTDLEYAGGMEIEYAAHNFLVGFRSYF